MNTIAFMTANYVARQVGYNMTEGWGQGENATNDYFRPIGTFAARFDEYMADVKAMGFEAVDIWLPLLHPNWATDAHIAAAKASLAKHALRVTSLAGWFGSDRAEFENSCKLAAALGTTVLGGNTALLNDDRPAMIGLLKEYGVKLGFENHPEKNVEEVLAKIGSDGEGTIGAAVDTGWFGTYSYDAPTALEALAPHLLHVHLKDVLAAGAHDTCRFGQGVVDIEGCARTLKRIGYTGSVCIEHEPHDADPTDDVIASYELLKQWLA